MHAHEDDEVGPFGPGVVARRLKSDLNTAIFSRAEDDAYRRREGPYAAKTILLGTKEVKARSIIYRASSRFERTG